MQHLKLINTQNKYLLSPRYFRKIVLKAELNSFFTKQYSLILPTSLTFYTDNRLSTVSFSHDDVGKILQNLNPHKAHGLDNISIHMLKICGLTTYSLLEIISKEVCFVFVCFGLFLSEWKKGNFVPIHKKLDKQVLKNYRPVLLLPICGRFMKD